MNITMIILILITVMNIVVGARVKEQFIGKRITSGVVDAIHTAGVNAVKDNMTKSEKETYKPVFKNLKKTIESFREAISTSGNKKRKSKKNKKNKKNRK